MGAEKDHLKFYPTTKHPSTASVAVPVTFLTVEEDVFKRTILVEKKVVSSEKHDTNKDGKSDLEEKVKTKEDSKK